jgi:chaperone BCS1
MIDILVELLKNNEFAQGALIAAPATALTYAARNIPVKIWGSVKHFVSYDLTFRSDQEEYHYVNKLVTEEVIAPKWSRDFSYERISFWDDAEGKDKDVFTGMAIGYGRHWGKFAGKPVIVSRSLEESDATATFKEILTVTFLGFGNRGVSEFCELVAKEVASQKENQRLRLRRNMSACWSSHGYLHYRPLDSVFTNNGVKERLLAELRSFENEEESYKQKGMPYHKGFLLKGPPGTGKTSLIHALASEMKRDIMFLNLSGVDEESHLMELIGCRRDWDKSILVIEDIDAVKANLTRESESDGISLSTLLNVLDGFLTPHGLITFATTNHPERLDPALVRSGRFDVSEEIGALEWEEAERMANLLLGENNQFGSFKDRYVPKVGAELREAMIGGRLSELFYR